MDSWSFLTNIASIMPKVQNSLELEKIKGHDFWRMRVGIYRIIYQIDDEKRVVNTYRIAYRNL